ncbi:hypothetical protein HK405_011815 [Cladochytrium tenue]|nr:hypothetical protein HK405_011815 [Cladochytrium tenue]
MSSGTSNAPNTQQYQPWENSSRPTASVFVAKPMEEQRYPSGAYTSRPRFTQSVPLHLLSCAQPVSAIPQQPPRHQGPYSTTASANSSVTFLEVIPPNNGNYAVVSNPIAVNSPVPPPPPPAHSNYPPSIILQDHYGGPITYVPVNAHAHGPPRSAQPLHGDGGRPMYYVRGPEAIRPEVLQVVTATPNARPVVNVASFRPPVSGGFSSVAKPVDDRIYIQGDIPRSAPSGATTIQLHTPPKAPAASDVSLSSDPSTAMSQSHHPSPAGGAELTFHCEGKRTNYSAKVRSVLLAWLNLNRDDPYPSEPEKQELSRRTGLNLQQINNWFINARRRQYLYALDRNARSGAEEAADGIARMSREIPGVEVLRGNSRGRLAKARLHSMAARRAPYSSDSAVAAGTSPNATRHSPRPVHTPFTSLHPTEGETPLPASTAPESAVSGVVAAALPVRTMSQPPPAPLEPTPRTSASLTPSDRLACPLPAAAASDAPHSPTAAVASCSTPPRPPHCDVAALSPVSSRPGSETVEDDGYASAPSSSGGVRVRQEKFSLMSILG